MRDAFVRSVTCAAPPVRFQAIQRVDRPERELRLRAVDLVENPFELAGREVRVAHEARPLADELGRQRGTPGRSASVLPDDRRVHRPPCCPLPHDRRLALVREADRRQLLGPDPGLGERRGRSLEDALPELERVVLDPPRPGILLRDLAVAAPDGRQALVDDEAGRPRRALVDRKKHVPLPDEAFHERHVDRVDQLVGTLQPLVGQRASHGEAA